MYKVILLISAPVQFAGKATQMVAAFDEIKQQLGHPEVLIYNAGPGGMSWPPPSKAPRMLLCTIHDVHDMTRKRHDCIMLHFGQSELCRHNRANSQVQIGNDNQQLCSIPRLTQPRQDLAHNLDCN